ncbi:hypothetical protein L2E47_18645, partial [Pseudomonas aeruginosa]|nr:hypothetical protein [Pseudomonas aeruginosa]
SLSLIMHASFTSQQSIPAGFGSSAFLFFFVSVLSTHDNSLYQAGPGSTYRHRPCAGVPDEVEPIRRPPGDDETRLKRTSR